MVRKSNKTNHVLSLLSNGGKDKAQEGNTEVPGPPVVPDEDRDRDNKQKEKEKEAEASSVSIVHTSSEKEGLAETIKKSLEEELGKMIPEVVSEKAAENVTENAVENENAEAEEAAEAMHRILKSELQNTETDGSKMDKSKELEIEVEPEVVKEKPEPKMVIEEPKPEDIEEFVFLNVMEALVKEKVQDYMKQFGNCTCPRCVADTSALALSQLPPKYVVINKEAVSPLMNFYTKKFAGQITVEITKACIRVGEAPHHNRG